jgi:malate dehydrogenase (oxaloacetate-decarboxylating)(NADP+)
VQTIVDEGLAKPILIGRPSVVESRIEKLGLRLKINEHFELTNPESDPRFWDYWTTYHAIMERRGVSPDAAKAIVRTRTSVIAALMVHRKEADALIAGVVGRYQEKLRNILDVIGLREGGKVVGSLGVLNTEDGAYFICDTHVNPNPTAEEIAEITVMAAEVVKIFGIRPRVALLSHSSFGSHEDPSAVKMKEALALLHERVPDLEVDGEMPADMALSETYRKLVFPNSRLRGPANLLVMPDLDSAHIAFNLARVVAKGVSVGPVLMGAAKPVHVLTPSATVRRIVNMTALAVVDAQLHERKERAAATGGNG